MGPKVPKGQSLVEAEKRALSGDIESQDSQLFLEQYHQKYAPGLRSSSPSQPLPPEVVQNQLQQYTRPTKVHQRFAGVPTSAPAPIAKLRSKPKADSRSNSRRGRSAKDSPAKDKGEQQHTAGAIAERPGGARTKAAPNASVSHNKRASSQSPRHDEITKPPELPSDPEASIEPQAIGKRYLRNHLHAPDGTVNPSLLTRVSSDDDNDGNDRNSSPPTHVSASLTARKKPKAGLSKMEISQSPTQSNDGRSYDKYLPRGDDLVPTESPELEPVSQHSEHASDFQDENRSLHEDDTGAVNFDRINEYDTGTDFTAPGSVGTGIPSHGQPSQLTGYPETPAPHKNPFARSKAHLLGSSQMFKQTQVSSACKAVSPTSSRPSPDNFQLQDLFSPNGIISSPLKNLVRPSPLPGAISSPHLPPYDTSPQQAGHELPVSDEDVTNSPLLRPARRLTTGLMESYTRMHKPQDKIEPSHNLDPDTDSDDDSDYDGVERRRRLAMLKKMAAEKQLQSINVERLSAIEDTVVPSTNTGKENTCKTNPQLYLAQCGDRAEKGSQDAVEDSQDVTVYPAAGYIDTQQAVIGDSQADDPVASPDHANHVSSNGGVVSDTLPNTARSPSMSPLASEEKTVPKPQNGSNRPRREHADAIPETSPARLRPLGEMLPHSSDEVSKPESFSNLLGSSFQDNSLDRNGEHIEHIPPNIQSSASLPAQKPNRTDRKYARDPLVATVNQDQSEDTMPGIAAHSETVETTEASLLVSSSPPSPAASTKSRPRGKREHGHSISPEDPASSVSTLSVLTTTPVISNKTTPLTQESSANTGNLTPSSSNDPQTSPTVAKAKRRGSASAASKPKPEKAPQRSLRASTRRSSRSFAGRVSLSSDELARSPSSSTPRTFEQSAMLSRLGRTSLRETSGSRETSRGAGAKILTGMAFAISFQSKEPNEKDSHYNSRLGLSEKIADKIKQAGGRVLASGFDELFEFATIKNAEVASSTPPPDDDIKLTAAARHTGFTALIADGHSRKVKYMQALALGLPCIHERWITTCVENQKLVDWSDYLLCAGNSLFLGGAIRSRTLPSYDVASAKLSEVIEHRPRLLHGSRILLVLRKKDESQKMAYVFLARVLGASLSRVYSMDEAKRHLKASEDAGHPYSWVYVGDTMAARADLFSDGASSASLPSTALTATKKRKRQSEAGSSLTSPPLKRIRTLSNELVIQSLILGRLLEEEEMKGRVSV